MEFNCNNQEIIDICGIEKDGNGIYENNDGKKINKFECSRLCNITKLRNIYKEELNRYYEAYNKYLTIKFNQNDRNRAENASEIEQDIISHKENLSKILDSLKNNIVITDSKIQEYNQDIINTNDNIADRNSFGETDRMIFKSCGKVDSSSRNFNIVLALTFLNMEPNMVEPFPLLLANTSKKSKS